MLLRDCDKPERFVSFGPWESMQAVRNWRALAGYQERVAELREVVDHFEPRTLEVVARRWSASLPLLNSRGILRSGGRKIGCKHSTGWNTKPGLRMPTPLTSLAQG
jgi:hypothetical protein